MSARVLRREPGFTVIGRLPEGGGTIGHFGLEADANDYATAIDIANRQERSKRVSGAWASGDRPSDTEPA